MDLKNRGENWDRLVARIAAVEMEKDFGDASIATLKKAAELGMLGAYHALGVDNAEGMVQILRMSKEGFYRQKTDEEIAKIIMDAAKERESKKHGNTRP